jgi:hypothetical protein
LDDLDATILYTNPRNTLAVVHFKGRLEFVDVPGKRALASILLPEQTQYRVGFSDRIVGVALCNGKPLKSSFYVLDCRKPDVEMLARTTNLDGCIEWVFGSAEGIGFGTLALDHSNYSTILHSFFISGLQFKHTQRELQGHTFFDSSHMHDHFFVLRGSSVERHSVTPEGVSVTRAVAFEGVDFDSTGGGFVSETADVVLIRSPSSQTGGGRLIDPSGVLVPEAPGGRLAVSRDGGVCIIDPSRNLRIHGPSVRSR